MSFPVHLSLFGLALHPHVVFETLGYFVGFRLYLWGRRRQGDVIPAPTRWWAITAAALGGAFGSKLLAWLEDPSALQAHWREPAFFLAGKTIVGGLLGGLVVVEVVKWVLGERRSTGDLFAIPLAVGIAIGRIGCFLTGLDDHTYGVATSLPWGVDFGDGVSRHPTQLYECIFLVAFAIVLARVRVVLTRSGDAFKVFMIGYLAFRLAIDAIKPAPAVWGLATIQWACVAGLVYYGNDIVRLGRAALDGRLRRDTAIHTT